ARPRAVGPAILRTAAQADAAGVDGLLAERAEAFPLEGLVAPAHLAAHEELLQAVVDRAREHHAAQDLAPFLARERRADGLARQEAVARLHHLRPRLFQPTDRSRARRR